MRWQKVYMRCEMIRIFYNLVAIPFLIVADLFIYL